MKPQKNAILITILLTLLAACTPAAGPESGLAGTRWELQSLDGNDQIGAAIGRQPITLNFSSGTEAEGSGGCNSFGGSYQADASAGAITFSDLISTLMACEGEGIGEAEALYFLALNAATNYTISGGTLTITGGTHTLIFVRA